MVCDAITKDQMEVSATKCLVTASSPTLGWALQHGLRKYKVKYQLRVKSLGVGMASGMCRNAKVINCRLKDFRCRLPSFRRLCRAGCDPVRVIRTGGAAGMTYC